MFRRSVLSLLILLFLLGSVTAQVIVGPTEPIEPKQPAWLEIQGVVEGSSATFFPSAQVQTGPPHIAPFHALFWAKESGVYQVNAMAVTVDWTGKSFSLTPLTCIITVKEVGPDPNPDPDPDPPPPPSDELWGVLIYEANDLDDNPQFAKVVVSSRLRAIPKFTLEPFDKDAKNENGELSSKVSGWLKIINDNSWKVPQLLLVNKSGDLVAHKTPEDVDDAVAFVKEHMK